MTNGDHAGSKALLGSLLDNDDGQIERPGLSFKSVSLTRNLGTDREIEVVRDISFSVGPGEIVSVIGPTGCGKTTLLQMAMGLLKPTVGEISLDGRTITGPSPQMGIIFQEHVLFPWLTVKQNVEFGLQLRHVGRKDRELQSQAVLDSVGLSRDGSRFPHELSGGMKRRVAIARLLANSASYLLMDEPFEALDFQTRLRMQQFLLSVHSKFSKSILLVTHQVDEALLLSDRVLFMGTGPGNIIREFTISLERPRDSKGDLFGRYRNEIIELLQRESGKMFQSA